MSGDPRHTLGAAGERLAAEHLRRRGFAILESNYRTRWGELDLIGYDGRTIAFCEVKTRRDGGSGGTALEALSPAKQAQVRRVAARWLHERTDRPRASALRFDAIAVTVDREGRLLQLDHIEDAF